MLTLLPFLLPFSLSPFWPSTYHLLHYIIYYVCTLSISSCWNVSSKRAGVFAHRCNPSTCNSAWHEEMLSTPSLTANLAQLPHVLH